MRQLFRDTINGYVFWSLFQALAPMIWFYPLNELEISGYEAFAVLWLTPIIFVIPGIFPAQNNRWVLGFLRLASVVGLVSFQAPDTLSRLIVLSVGCGIASLWMAVSICSQSQRIRSQFYWSLILGLFLFLSSRIWFTSFVPAWWSSQSNTVIITLAVIAAIDQIISGDDTVKESDTPVSRADRPYWLPASLGFGSLLFLSYWCFGEVSLITRWVVRGYPDNGPLPYPWGALVLVALGFGVYMSQCRTMSTSYIWWFVGLVSFGILYYLPTWQGFTGGLVLAVYTMSVWPWMYDKISQCPPACLTLSLLIFIIEILFFVWTVAFNFVPGGVYTREHTDWLIAAVMLLILIGLKSGGKNEESRAAFPTVDKVKLPLTSQRICLVFFIVVGLLGFVSRYDPHRYEHPAKEEPRIFSAAIWTYHFGYDNKGWPSLERSAAVLKDTEADVITLLESDASKPFLGNNDLGMWLGEKLGMYVDFGPATKDHTWGNLILSKYPFVKSKHHLLPSPHGELAPAVTATVNISGNLVDFVVTHMGNDRDVLDRKLQAEYLAEELRNSENPAVFLGYVTSAPGSRDYRHLLTSGGVKDIDLSDRDRWCEYIMYKGLIKLGYARITHGGLSDTEIQMGKFKIPEDPKSYKDNRKVTTKPADVDKKLHFNPRFGSLHRGHGHFPYHGFHMTTPKYFLP
ncbi:PGAP2-interacting protein-like [Gigantopelta aegis]|uniref:PGAP2-interacting protein-like n=1 Tax=Gigantopelta aegis TaxID=1735272 RepID=UPI001B889CC6|nr:PGAP2-interacting protein-like [Gigantopelta aegis]